MSYIRTRPGAAFSNGTSWHIWESNWCERCAVDAGFRAGTSDTGCDLLLIALIGEETPAAWFETEPGCPDAYRCVNFRSLDDGPSPEPRPIPEPPNMDGLFERPQERVRMLKQQSEARKAVAS